MSFRSHFAVLPAVWLCVAAAAAQARELTVGHADVIAPERSPSTIVVGNPEVVDATVASPRTVIVTAKAVGATNVILLDQGGAVIADLPIQVVPSDRRPRFRIRTVEGGSGGVRAYSCGPEPGCDLVVPAPPPPTLQVIAPTQLSAQTSTDSRASDQLGGERRRSD